MKIPDTEATKVYIVPVIIPYYVFDIYRSIWKFVKPVVPSFTYTRTLFTF